MVARNNINKIKKKAGLNTVKRSGNPPTNVDSYIQSFHSIVKWTWVCTFLVFVNVMAKRLLQATIFIGHPSYCSYLCKKKKKKESRNVRKRTFSHVRLGRLRSACIFTQSNSLRWYSVDRQVHCSQRFSKRTEKTLFRPYGCTGWLDSSQCVHCHKLYFLTLQILYCWIH